MKNIVKYHDEPIVKEPIKNSVLLRKSNNTVRGSRYDVYLIPVPVGMIRQLNIPAGLVVDVCYDPNDRNKLTLRWDNGAESKTDVEGQA